MIIDNVTPLAAVGLLIFLRKTYGNRFSRTYEEIASDYHNPNVSKWKIKECILELEKMGYVKARSYGTGKKKHYTIDEDHYRGLVWLTEDGKPLESFYLKKGSTDELTESDNEDNEDE